METRAFYKTKATLADIVELIRKMDPKLHGYLGPDVRIELESYLVQAEAALSHGEFFPHTELLRQVLLYEVFDCLGKHPWAPADHLTPMVMEILLGCLSDDLELKEAKATPIEMRIKTYIRKLKREIQHHRVQAHKLSELNGIKSRYIQQLEWKLASNYQKHAIPGEKETKNVLSATGSGTN